MEKYYQCQKCYQILPISQLVENKECKYCASKKFDIWPSSEIQELFNAVDKFEEETLEYNIIASVFISSALELLLEKLIYIMAIEDLSYEQADHLVECVLDTNQGRSRRLNLFKYFGYGSFNDHVSKIGYKKYMKKWEKIINIRNKSVHGEVKNLEKLSKNFLNNFIDESLDIFSTLNNIYNEESFTFKYSVNKNSYI